MMNDKYKLDDISEEQYRNSLSNKRFRLKNNNLYLTEEDFYRPSDDRVLESYIEDIDGGDNFADYCEYIFELYEEEGYYD